MKRVEKGNRNYHGRRVEVGAGSAHTVKMLFVTDLHYVLKQFDWLMANASRFDAVIIGGDLLDLGSALEIDVQIVVIEKYLERLRGQTRLLVSSGNHDGDNRLATNESICRWLREAKAGQLFVDGDSVEVDGTLITICPVVGCTGDASRD
jgi:predicted MPP superfamily phosphohydrolase